MYSQAIAKSLLFYGNVDSKGGEASGVIIVHCDIVVSYDSKL